MTVQLRRICDDGGNPCNHRRVRRDDRQVLRHQPAELRALRRRHHLQRQRGVCGAGVCQAGTPLVCVDANECTQDLVCAPALGGQFPSVPDGTRCNGGAGTCTTGVCS